MKKAHDHYDFNGEDVGMITKNFLSLLK